MTIIWLRQEKLLIIIAAAVTPWYHNCNVNVVYGPSSADIVLLIKKFFSANVNS